VCVTVCQNEMMTGTYTQNPVMSRITLALMEDSGFVLFLSFRADLTSTWPHLNSDVGLEEGEY